MSRAPDVSALSCNGAITDRLAPDLHSDNLLIGIMDDSIFAKVEENEVREPSARKQDDDRSIYVSRYMLGGAGALTICDFGQARIGCEHDALAMPLPFRAPEVILGMKWGSPVDLWAVGLLVRPSPPETSVCSCGSSLATNTHTPGMEPARAGGALRRVRHRVPRAQRRPPSRRHDRPPGPAAARVSRAERGDTPVLVGRR